jgi:hypothetical protein
MSLSRLPQQISIDRRFCGPPQSGNGGYVCGRMAEYIVGCAKVRLMSPPPLETPLRLTCSKDEVLLFDDEFLVAKAAPHQLDIEAPPSPSLEMARSMSEHYVGFSHTAFPQCFVCGPERKKGDGLRIFPGVSRDASMVACVWEPSAELFGTDGRLKTWAVWSALDCPSGWAFLHQGEGPALLGEYAVDIISPIVNGHAFIVVGWEFENTGRKHKTGSALYSSQGRLLACAQATWIEFKPEAG